MNKTEIEKLSRAVVKLIDKGERQYADWIHQNDKKIVKGLLSVYGAMPTTKDGYVNKTGLRKFLATRRAQVTKVLNSLGYSLMVEQYLANFDEITKLNIQLQDAISGLDAQALAKFASPVQKLLTNLTYDSLVGAGLHNIFFAQIEKTLLQIGTVGVSLQEAVLALNDAIVGTGQYSRFSNYALTAGRDALGQYDGTINQKIASEFGLNAVVYVGTLVENSRPQCERWLEYEFIPMSELDNELDWAFANGSGMVAQTTPATFVIYRGGYSCRHKAVPIRVTQEQLDAWQPL